MSENNYIVYIGKDSKSPLAVGLSETSFKVKFFDDLFVAYSNSLSDVYGRKKLPYAFIIREDFFKEEALNFIQNLKKCPALKDIPTILYNPNMGKRNVRAAKRNGADDFYSGIFKLQDMLDRIEFLHKTKSKTNSKNPPKEHQADFRISTAKRFFDIFFSCIALLILSPILILISILIWVESPGPVFYISKRVGTGYRIFDFYKFRSMRPDADKIMASLMHLNQYNNAIDPTFIKIDNDPRVTKIGRFIRNFSLDELPQLINVLKGDMSIVGNRPLPLYEAERITKDLWSKRFLAPAGLTGLWQVTKRGKKDMSAEERIALDMAYADNSSLWFDMKIVAQTFPAIIQKESV